MGSTPMSQRRNKKKIKKYVGTNKNRNTTYWNLQDKAKTFLRGKFIAINVYMSKKERAQINNQSVYLKEIEKEISQVQALQKEGNSKY